MPLTLSTALKYYKRREVQEAIVAHATDREVSPRYGEGFGKRPDVLVNPRDVLEFAQRRATSFHCSEERWSNPLDIQTGMSRKDASALRCGWDLVLDIDAKDWEISRLTAWLFVAALRAHNIEGVTVKFSGNKGWHVGVAWESFPQTVFLNGQDVATSDLFPDLPRAIATYLVEYIGDTANGLVRIHDDEILFGGKVKGSLEAIARKAGREQRKILSSWCSACRKQVERGGEQYGLMCPSGHQSKEKFTAEQKASIDDTQLVCPKCKGVREFYLASRGSGCPHDPKSYSQRFAITEVIEFDTILLASRHLYRSAYSLHEKSGLASAVIDPENILSFKKEEAQPESVDLSRRFLDPALARPSEAAALIAQALERMESAAAKPAVQREFEPVGEMIAIEHFPPCMLKILEGLQDGKKRAMFALTNFLQMTGWPPEAIEKLLFEWNEKNPEPLREVVIRGHLRSHVGPGKLPILPPNCMQFYRELGVCNPDDLCRTIKNPVMYAVKHEKMGKRGKKHE